MRRSISTFVIVLAVTVFLATGVSAQNLLVNPDFDNDVSGWTGLGNWDPLDVAGLATSGSATWINPHPDTSGSHYLTQCVEMTSFIEGFDVRSWMVIPSGQAGTGYAAITAWFYSDSVCSEFIWSDETPIVLSVGSWQATTLTDWTPTGAASVRIGLASQKYGAGDFQVIHDSVFFGPNPDMVFGDGFETTDSSEWSAVSAGME